jgi:NAD(P)-dependent dehydrogenase (short-subunit alcohol dehydrogenase family)
MDRMERTSMMLAGKVAIVTGASSGIGRATARLFASEGASVVAVARRERELATLVEEIGGAGGDAIAVPGDVTSEPFIRTLVDTTVARFGGLDVAFNNAGTLGEMGATPTLSLEAWRHAVDTNLTSAFLAAKYQIPAMLARGGGSLIFTASFVGYTVGVPGAAPYAAGKSGLIGLTQALAVEFGPQRIRVNALLPGGTDTPMARAMNGSPDAWAWVESLHALKRIASPDEQAQSALYLASDASSFTTGIALLVDGGVSINRT